MPEKFTNICGGAFQPYIAKQIEVRKKFLEESNVKRENKHLIYLNNKNSWFRLTSCTDVSQNHPLFSKYNLSGDALAKKYILQGGTVSSDGKTITNRSGIGEDGMYNMLPNKPLGIKPMPGITSIDLSSAGRLGTLQYATIKFTCYDLEQLEIFDALYMKLGFSLILEWGHTIFLDEDSNIKNPTPLNAFEHHTKENLIKAIQRKRLSHSGNYDAMLGTVSNFGWEAKPNGSYDCEIKLVGAGDILESLKINQAVNQSTNFTSVKSEEGEKENQSSQIADKDLSLLNQALFSIYQQVLNFSPNKNNGVRVIGTNAKSYRKVLNKIYSNCPYEFIKFNEDGDLIGDDISIRGNQFSLISGLNIDNGGEPTDIPLNDKSLFYSVGVPYQITPTDKSGGDSQVYITLGHLIALVQATGMLYNTTDNKNGKPHIYLDFNDQMNYCSTYKGQMSLDPKVCIIPRNQSNIDDPFGIGVIEDTLFNSIGGVVTKKQYISNPISVGIPGGSVVINNQQRTISETRPYGFVNSYLNVSSSEKDVRARMMYIMVNINYITDTLRQIREKDPHGVVNYSDFINSILEGISKALGGFNEFRLLVDDSSKCARIIDDNTTTTYQEADSPELYTEIPLFGENSIVYNYSFKSKIGPNMASMITIAAQANPQSLGDDVFAISNLSRGLIDRVNTEKTPSNFTTSSQSTNNNKDNINTLKQHIEGVLGSNNNFILNIEAVEPSENTYKELLANYRTKQDSTNKASTIIPLDFSLEMDGLSGIIPNSAFIAPTNLLPSSYKTKDNKPKIAFIIHTINQSFTNNKWKTKLTGQTINIRFDKEDIQVYSPISTVDSFGGVNSGVDPATKSLLLTPGCTRRAQDLLGQSTHNIAIQALKDAAGSIGIISKQAIASLIAISAGESSFSKRVEDHVYSEGRLRQIFPNLTESQYKRALRKGITKPEFFSIVYGEYDPKRVGNRNISDGGKYYGRGFIQLTGYENYKKYAKLSGIDIVSNPDLLKDIPIGAKIAAIYMQDRTKTSQYDTNYFEKALNAVGYNVGDIRQKKIEYYNCYIGK